MNIRLGQKVYIVFGESINEETVLMKGKDCFCHSRAFDHFMLDSYRDPCYDYEEGTCWFRKFKDAKAYLLKQYPDCIIKKVDEGYWEVYER